MGRRTCARMSGENAKAAVRRLDELAGRVKMKSRDVAKAVQRMLDDHVLAVHRRAEQHEGQFKASQRAYYYIDYVHCTDVIRWRIHRMLKQVTESTSNVLDSQGYICPFCHAKYTSFDAPSLFDPSTQKFLCEACRNEVYDNQENEDVQRSRRKMQRLQEQTKVVQDALRRCDEVTLPSFDIAHWLDVNRPLAGVKAKADDSGPKSAMDVRIEMAGEDEDEDERQRKEAEQAQKRRQNELPAWIAKSTISGDASSAGAREAERRRREQDPDQDDSKLVDQEDHAHASAATDDIAAYYASLQEREGSEVTTPTEERKRAREDSSGDDAAGSKRARYETGDSGSATAVPADEDEDEFDAVEDVADDDTMVMVNGEARPFSEVSQSDELQQSMTPEEYEAFWNLLSAMPQ